LRIGTKVIHEYISTCPLIFIYLGAYFIETTGQLEPPHRSAAPHSAMFPFAPTPLPVIAVVFSPLAVHKHLMKRVLLAVCRRDTLVRPAVTASTAAQCPGIDRSISRFPDSPTSGVAYLLAVHQHLMMRVLPPSI
jgi:hypothetical protein